MVYAALTENPGIAHEALRFYKNSMPLNAGLKKTNSTPEQRYALRQSESKPILEEFKAWMDASYPLTIAPQSQRQVKPLLIVLREIAGKVLLASWRMVG